MRRKKRIRRFNRIILLLCAGAGALLAFFLIRSFLEDAREKKAARLRAEELNGPQNGISLITYEGKTYRSNPHIRSYLFIGVDEREEDFVDENLAPGDAGQADCLILLILNTQTQEGQLLQINRNAMTELDIYSSLGNVDQTVTGQICLQYAYCTGGKRSCFAQTGTVEGLLFDTEIRGYLSLSLPGIAEVNDALGGVEVTIDQDYTWIDPSFVQGSTLRLQGEAATRFVQYRDTSQFNSVEDRMHRQTTYVTALIDSLKDRGGESLYDTLQPFLDNVILTNLSAEEMSQLKDYTYDTENVLTLPGQMVQGEEFEEYQVDNSQLEALIIQLFYQEAEE